MFCWEKLILVIPLLIICTTILIGTVIILLSLKKDKNNIKEIVKENK